LCTQSWEPNARLSDALRPPQTHVLTATRAALGHGHGQASAASPLSGGSGGGNVNVSMDWAADEFSVPVRALVDDALPTLGLAEFSQSSRRFAEVFNLITRTHPNHAQHLRLLFTLERQFARTLGATFSAMERALWVLQEQQNREMEKASHLALTDPAKVPRCVSQMMAVEYLAMKH
jgi:hypothetical protein